MMKMNETKTKNIETYNVGSNALSVAPIFEPKESKGKIKSESLKSINGRWLKTSCFRNNELRIEDIDMPFG